MNYVPFPPTASATATPSPPPPIPLPGEACSPLDIAREDTGIYVFDVTTCELGRFNSAPSDASVTWSPDGAKLAFIRLHAPTPKAGSDVFILDLENGSETQVTFSPGDRESYLSWSPDGSALAFYSRPTSDDPSVQTGLWLLELGTVRQRLLHPNVGGSCDRDWSPDSSVIVFGCTKQEFHLVEVATGATRLLESNYGYGEPDWSPSGEVIAYSCQDDAKTTYFACTIRPDGTGRVMFPDRGEGVTWNFTGDRVVFYDGNTLFFGDPATGGYTRVIEEWKGGEPEVFLSERVLTGISCRFPNVSPCSHYRRITDTESGKSIESPVGAGTQWSPNRRYLAFAVGDYGVYAL